MFLVLPFAYLGNRDFHKLHVRTFPETPENTAYNDNYSRFELPFQMELKKFAAEFYDNGQPRSYTAEIAVKNDEKKEDVILAINHPARFMGYDVYLESFDKTNVQNPNFVTFLVIYDRYVYAKYFGIIVLLAGLCLNIGKLSFSKNRLPALLTALLGLGFSLLPFGQYLFGEKHLVPALQSFWFVPHIVVYMLAYSALTIAFLWSIYALFSRPSVIPCLTRNLPENRRDYEGIGFAELHFAPVAGQARNDDHSFLTFEAVSTTTFLLNFGTSMMGIGLLFGALWAKVAWGNFWSFDIKENLAAIAWFAFLIVIHFENFRINRRKMHATLVIIAYLLLQICWFGVNFLPMGSLHRY